MDAKMGYIDSTLGRNEALYYTARFHWSYHAAAWGALCLLLAIGFAISASGLPLVGLPIILLGVAVFLGIMIPIWTTEIGVTSQRLIYKRGLFERTTDELQLRAIEGVNV